MNTFEFTGKLVPCKETENFKPLETKKFPSGDWGLKSLKFNVVAGTNRHLVEISDLINVNNPDSMKIYTFSKGGQDNDGNAIKGDKMEVKWKDRTNPEIVGKVANFKKFVLDTELPNRRQSLQKAVDKFKDGSITDEQMDSLGVHSLEEAESELATSEKRRKEFITAYDFIDAVNKVVNNSKAKDMVFRITGTIDLDYSEAKDQWYRHLNVQRIYRADDDAPVQSKAHYTVVYGADAVDDANFEEKKKIHVEAFTEQYINKYKKKFFAPMGFTIDGTKDERKAQFFAKKFAFPDDYEGEYREIGLECTMLNGSQKVELTEDMLTDEQRENIEFGLCTLEDIVKEMGGDVYGDRVTDIVIDKLGRGYSKGSMATAYTADDMCKPHNELADEDDMDIFDEDEDDI